MTKVLSQVTESLTNTSVAFAVIASFVIGHFFLTDLPSPERDQLRYIDYANNLISHRTFGLSCGEFDAPPQPGNANAPLYPVLLASAAAFDSDLEEQYTCVLERHGVRGDCLIGTGQEPDVVSPGPENCPEEDFAGIALVNHVLLFACLALLFLIGKDFFQSAKIAWLTLFVAMLSGIFTEYVGRVLTEILLLPLFLAMQYCLLRYFRAPKSLAVIAMGVCLGLLSLTRPEYPYLAVAASFLLLGVAIWRQDKKYLIHGLLLLIAFAITLSPWLLRNKQQFDNWAISAGNYGEITLAYRVAYNDMDAKHFTAAFIYFLPDFGDSLTKRLFPEDWYWREIDELPGSYQDVTNEMLEATGKGELTLPGMLELKVLGDLPKHLMTTVPLSWRGVFIAKYWGLIAFFVYLIFQVKELHKGKLELAILALPCWLLVGLHAGISINIPRYNLPLVSIYALSLAWLITSFTGKRPGTEPKP